MKSNKKLLRVGIAGYGVVGKRRRTVIDAHPRMQTIAVSDKNLIGRNFEGSARCYTNFNDLLSEDIDVLFVDFEILDTFNIVQIGGLYRFLTQKDLQIIWLAIKLVVFLLIFSKLHFIGQSAFSRFNVFFAKTQKAF